MWARAVQVGAGSKRLLARCDTRRGVWTCMRRPQVRRVQRTSNGAGSKSPDELRHCVGAALLSEHLAPQVASQTTEALAVARPPHPRLRPHAPHTPHAKGRTERVGGRARVPHV